jgi:hypothetical protein
MSWRQSGDAAGRASAARGPRGWLRRWRQRARGSPAEAARSAAAATGTADDAAPRRAIGIPGPPDAGATEPGLSAGDYITDGSSLFHVEHTHMDSGSGTLLVEVENCVTLELSVWSADALAAQPVRCVTPVRTPERSDPTWPEGHDVPARSLR